MSGTSPTEFSPNEVTSKAMILTILHRMVVAPEATQAEKIWYKMAQTWEVENGISDGNGIMEPITREELVTFMWRCTGEARLTEYEGLRSFRDASEISDFAIHAMKWAHESGIITGTSEKTLSPKGETTRAEVAVLLLRFNDLWAMQ